MISIIIPTYNEKGSIPVLVERLRGALHGESYEVIFVDDSTDDTPQRLAEVHQQHPEFRYIHRENERGLATAVIRGFEAAKGDVLAVMDADLQHPPELLTEMLSQIQQGADLVLPSRFVHGGGDEGLKFHRKVISKGARLIGQLALKRVRRVTDPMSGFFMFRKSVIKNVEWNAIGWKILLEILVKGNYKKVVEVPYAFQERVADESKMSMNEQLNYLRHILRLVLSSPEDRRFYVFALVGLSGVLVNMFLFWLLNGVFHVQYSLAAFISATTAMISNFILNDKFTWPGYKQEHVASRFLKNIAVSVAGIGINLLVLYILHERAGMAAWLANLIGIFTATAWNYIINNLWTWRQRSEVSPRSMNDYGRP